MNITLYSGPCQAVMVILCGYIHILRMNNVIITTLLGAKVDFGPGNMKVKGTLEPHQQAVFRSPQQGPGGERLKQDVAWLMTVARD